eukprot:64517-Pleurochrysis_carterae.AAC.4
MEAEREGWRISGLASTTVGARWGLNCGAVDVELRKNRTWAAGGRRRKIQESMLRLYESVEFASPRQPSHRSINQLGLICSLPCSSAPALGCTAACSHRDGTHAALGVNVLLAPCSSRARSSERERTELRAEGRARLFRVGGRTAALGAQLLGGEAALLRTREGTRETLRPSSRQAWREGSKRNEGGKRRAINQLRRNHGARGKAASRRPAEGGLKAPGGSRLSGCERARRPGRWKEVDRKSEKKQWKAIGGGRPVVKMRG